MTLSVTSSVFAGNTKVLTVAAGSSLDFVNNLVCAIGDGLTVTDDGGATNNGSVLARIGTSNPATKGRGCGAQLSTTQLARV